jgi:hypothetical protein
MISQGHCHTLIWVAIAKRALQEEMPAPMRLRFLELLDKLADAKVTPEVIARIDPMPDAGWQIVREARSIDPPDDKLAKASFKILTSEPAWGYLTRINPSMMAAVEWQRAALDARERELQSATDVPPAAIGLAPPPRADNFIPERK